jgi:hypothetical protein
MDNLFAAGDFRPIHHRRGLWRFTRVRHNRIVKEPTDFRLQISEWKSEGGRRSQGGRRLHWKARGTGTFFGDHDSLETTNSSPKNKPVPGL